MTALGLDFGTTNTVIALPARGKGETRSLTFESQAGVTDTMRTCLSFMKDRQAGVGAPLATEAGAAAIRTLIDHPGECRFLQSIKTYAASPLFRETAVLGRRHSFPDLMAVFLEKLMTYAGDGWPGDISRVAAGRPVRFAGTGADEALALERYNEALSRFGFPEIRFVLEPVAAAWYFASRLESDANVLVADFGGGTTDYSIIRFSKSAGKLSAEPLSHSGVGVAGDMFDYRIIDNVVSPMLGKGSSYKSFGKVLDVPSNYYASFGRWSQLSIFKTTRDFIDLKSLVRDATDPDALELFIDLVENDEGYPLYEAISATKRALSAQEEAEFFFAPLGKDSRRTVRRADFERWIAGEIDQMESALDEAIAGAGIAASQIDKVFLTGGSSFVPAVRKIFEDRFDTARIETGGELLSIAHGLALIGAEDDFPDGM
ncbi:Hsp70 family protein [Martelella mangrovi]|uniref:Chaperone protein n=1 Tax=Martelella mangrovi TaxID=1397477 RepID=A0ABV2I643_9HYPH